MIDKYEEKFDFSSIVSDIPVCPVCGLLGLNMESAEYLRHELIKEYGLYIPLSRIWRQLSYASLDAARKAARRGTSPIECVSLPGHRGPFLRVTDVAKWLGRQSVSLSDADALLSCVRRDGASVISSTVIAKSRQE